MLKQISSLIKRYPPLFHALRPVVYFFFRIRNSLIARFAIYRTWLSHARFPRMQAVGEAKSPNRRIGRSASGREVVMLVVSDLRVDSRVEREARVLAAAGYDVTVICPEP